MTDQMPDAPDLSAAVPRKKSEKRQRQKQVKIRLLEDEFNAVSAKAAASGLSNAAYTRAALLGDAGPRAQRRLPIDALELRKALGLLGAYGNNLNQLAFQANAHGELPTEAALRDMLQEWGAIRDTMLAALGKPVAPA